MGISPSTINSPFCFLIVKRGFLPTNDHLLHLSPCSTDSSRKPELFPTILSKAATGVTKSATNSFQTGITVCFFECSINWSTEDCILEIQSSWPLVKAFSCNGMNVSFPKDDIVTSPNFNFISIFGVKQNLIAYFHSPYIWSSRLNLSPC